MKNCDLPMKNCDLPIKNGDLPIKNGDLPINSMVTFQFAKCGHVYHQTLPRSRDFYPTLESRSSIKRMVFVSSCGACVPCVCIKAHDIHVYIYIDRYIRTI